MTYGYSHGILVSECGYINIDERDVNFNTAQRTYQIVESCSNFILISRCEEF